MWKIMRSTPVTRGGHQSQEHRMHHTPLTTNYVTAVGLYVAAADQDVTTGRANQT